MDRSRLRGLRLHGAGVELRVPDHDELEALAALAAKGIHPPERTPFAHPWTDLAGDELHDAFLQFHRRCEATWGTERWNVPFAVHAGGELVGVQAAEGAWAEGRLSVETGSWLGRAFQGRGYGTLMRAAVLELVFAGLGAEVATSGAFELNTASARVSLRLGYRPDGQAFLAPRGVPLRQRRFRITREEWLGKPDRPATRIAGLDACRALFGAPG